MKKNKGVLTLEAALVVPIFMFFIMFMWQFMKVVHLYDTVQANIFNTAKFINGYTYLLDATGIAESSGVSLDTIVEDIQEIFKPSNLDSKDEKINKLIDDILLGAKDGAIATVLNGSIKSIATDNLIDELDPNRTGNYIKNYGISSEFDFSDSKFSVDNGDEYGKLTIIVKYNVKFEIPIINIEKEIQLENRVVIKNFVGSS